MKIFPSVSSRANPDTSFSEGAIVLYDNNNNTVLGTIVGEKKGKYRVLNQRGSEIELPPVRLYPLPGKLPAQLQNQKEKVAYLDDLYKKAATNAIDVELSTIWESFEGAEVGTSTEDICRLFYGNNELLNHLTVRIALISDSTYFKRKNDTFVSRSIEAVQSLLKAREAEEAKARELKELINALKTRSTLPESATHTISLLEDLAAGVTEGPDTKESKDILNTLCDELGLPATGRPEDRAYSLLCAAGIFNDRTNLAFIKYRPLIKFPQAVEEEVKELLESGEADNEYERQDLTALHTFTIDDVSTEDMDDALSIEEIDGGYRVGIHISDVATSLAPGSALESEAKRRGTSIYCPEQTIHMLPSLLSQNKLSLRKGQRSKALSYFLTLDRSFEVLDYEIVLSTLEIKSRLSYDEVDKILDTKGHSGSTSLTLDEVRQLNLLQEIATKFEVDRIDAGAVRVNRKDVNVSVNKDGFVEIVEFDESSPARTLVGEMMIMANHLSARFCLDNNIPCIYRTQPDSDVDPFSNPDNIPSGPAYDLLVRMRLKRSSITVEPGRHSSLGLSSYTQVTSPIRRYLDLCVQRQLIHFSTYKSPHYSKSELNQIVIESETPLTNARYLSQESKRYWLLKYLEQDVVASPMIGATVIRTDLKYPIVQLDKVYLTVPIHIQRTVSLGEQLELRITAIDPKRDFIKFE